MPGAAASASRWPSRIALAIAAAVFAVGLARLAAYAAIAFRFSFAFDYGEGIVWQQMNDIVAGHGYARLGFDPAVVHNYPPLYHLATAAIAGSGMDPLYAGRFVSLAAALLTAWAIGAVTATIARAESRSVRLIAGGFAALAFLTLPLLDTWALLMRVDMLACLFTMTGLWLAIRAPRSRGAAVGAGLAFAAALYTRQTSLPAPIAALIVLGAARPRQAFWLFAALVGSSLTALAVLEVHSGGVFLLNILGYNINRVIWAHAHALALVLLSNIVVIVLGAIGVAAAWPGLGQGPWRARLAAPDRAAIALVLLMLALKTLMLPTILKSGASDNYLIDWFAPLCVLAGTAVMPLARTMRGETARVTPLLLLLVAVGLPIAAIGAGALPDRGAADREAVELARIVALIRANPKPTFSDDATLLLRAGQPLRWEPALIAELGTAGRYDEAAFARLVRRGGFGLAVTEGDTGDLLFDQRFNPLVADAVHAAFPRRTMIDGRIVHLPAGQND